MEENPSIRERLSTMFDIADAPRKVASSSYEDEDVKRIFRGHWENLSPEKLDEAFDYNLWPLLTEEAKRYYLPAVLTRLLDLSESGATNLSLPISLYGVWFERLLGPGNLGFSPEELALLEELQALLHKNLPAYFRCVTPTDPRLT